jgi:L-threonate 2-dehydrogenase
LIAIVVRAAKGRGYEAISGYQEEIALSTKNATQVVEGRSTFLNAAIPDRAGITVKMEIWLKLVGAKRIENRSCSRTFSVSQEQNMSNREKQTIAIIGAGEMGAAVGRRLLLSGAHVLTSLQGRSRGSVDRVRCAGLQVVDNDAALIDNANFVLSIVPPGAAVTVADRYRQFLAASDKNPIFAECNAIAPATARRIGALFEGSVCRYVDAGIIGGPPSERLDDAGPRFYAAGPYAHDLARLAEFGLDVRVLDGPIGAASGLKLSYAGLTKGITAIGAAMISAAVRDEVADALRDELARSQPQLLARLVRQVPAMFPKAYRWVSEMEQIAEFLGADDRGAMIYRGAARLYDRIATERVSNEDSYEMRALADFCVSGERVK